MKRTILTIMSVLTTLLAVSCSKEQAAGQGHLEVNGVFVQTRATIGESENSITAEWDIGDKIYGFWKDGDDVKQLSYSVCAVENSGAARFTLESGTEPSADGTPVHMLLAPGEGCGDFDGNGVAQINISQQDGTFNNLNNNIIYCATAHVVSGKITFTFVNRTALVDIKKIAGTSSRNIVSFCLEGKGISTGEARLVDGVLDVVPTPVTSCAGADFPSGHSPESPVWLAVLPQEGSRSFTAVATTLEDSFDKTVSTTLAAGTCTDVNTLTVSARSSVKGGEFTISDFQDKVRFSRGNLRVTRSNAYLYWAYAPNQFDYMAKPGTIMDVTAEGTFDLFGWSTDDGMNNWGLFNSTPQDPFLEDYVQGRFCDWAATMKDFSMKTLSDAEWKYVLTRRSASTVDGTADARYFKGTIELFDRRVNGLFLLPDTFTKPASIGFIQYINSPQMDYASNTFGYDEFLALEAAGVVFLPAAGYRSGTSLTECGNYGCYWTSQPGGEYNACEFYFFSSEGDANVTTRSQSRTLGKSVRLVKIIR